MTGTVATVGTFDGVHRGHQAVLVEIVRRARARGLASLVVTFDPHPLEVVNPAAAPRLLTLPDEKRELVAELPRRDLDDAGRTAVMHGRPVSAGMGDEGTVALFADGHLVAVAEREGELLKPRVVVADE